MTFAIGRALQARHLTTARHLATGRHLLSYVPYKLKEEILALHWEDGTRWNASTLASRFNAPRENVEAILRLGAVRKEREGVLRSMQNDRSDHITATRTRAMNAWSQLTEGVATGFRRSPAPPSQLQSSVEELTELMNGEGEDKDEDEEEVLDGEESEAVAVSEAKESAWSEYVAREAKSMGTDVERRTTFAFIEIGDEKEDVKRAVWIREKSGQVRLADDAERRILLNEERARDSQAWRS